MIDATLRAFIEHASLCFVATVDDDGHPNVSPKGSLCVRDAHTLAFIDIDSAGTVANLRRRPRVSINVVDFLRRRGWTFFGRASIHPPGTAEHAAVARPFQSRHGSRFPTRHVIEVDVSSHKEVRSPAYSYGEDVDEASLVQTFGQHYRVRRG